MLYLTPVSAPRVCVHRDDFGIVPNFDVDNVDEGTKQQNLLRTVFSHCATRTAIRRAMQIG